MSGRADLERTEALLRANEVWSPQDDDLRERVLRAAGTAHYRTRNDRSDARWFFGVCFVLFAVTTFYLRDAHHFNQMFRSRWVARPWMHPAEAHLLATTSSQTAVDASRRPFEWSLVQAHLYWQQYCLNLLRGLRS